MPTINALTRRLHPSARPRYHGPAGGGGSSSLPTTLTIQNYGGSTLAAGTPVRFAHVFGASDVPSGSTVALDIGGTTVPATFARRASGYNSELRVVDILAVLPSSIAASGSATVNVKAVASSSFNDTLPNGKTVANIVTDITTNHSAVGVTLETLTNSSNTTEGSGTWIADSTTGFGLSTAPEGYTCTATGPTAADFTVRMKLRDNTGGASHANLWAEFYITAFLDTTTGAVTELCWRVWICQGAHNVAQDRYHFTAKVRLGSTAVRTFGYAADNRVQSFAPSALNTSTGSITLTGHGFIRGEMVMLSTTGATPAVKGPSDPTYSPHLSLGIVDANTVSVHWDYGPTAAPTAGTLNISTLVLTSAGSGTLTWVDDYSGNKTINTVNVGANTLTITGHGWTTARAGYIQQAGGSLPGLRCGTGPFWASVIDANTVQLVQDQQSFDVNAPPSLIYADQGSGTHTLSGRVRLFQLQRVCLCDSTTLHDWHSGTGGALATRPTWHVVHSNTFCRHTGMTPPLDLSVTMTNATDPAPVAYGPGSNGRFDIAYGDTGARLDIGSVWNEWAARRLRYPGDRTGYVQTSRAQALMMGGCPIHMRNSGTFRVPVMNSGSYAGLGTNLSTDYYFGATNHTGGFATPTGGTDSATTPEVSHWSFITHANYCFDGGADLLELAYSEPNWRLMEKVPNSGYFSSRNLTYGARTYWTVLNDSSETRADAWALTQLVNAYLMAPDGSAEKSYWHDVLTDSVDLAWYEINTQGDSTWQAAGAWDTPIQRAGIGVAAAANMEGTESYMLAYVSISFGHAAVRLPTYANMQSLVTHHAKLAKHMWIDWNCKAYGTTYNIKLKVAPGTATNSTKHAVYTDFGVHMGGGNVLATFNGDGTTITVDWEYDDIGHVIPLQANDRVYFTDTGVYSDNTGDWNLPPTGVAPYTWYYVRQVSTVSQVDTFKVSTTPDDLNIVTWSGTQNHVDFYIDVFNRTTGCPTKIYRHDGYMSDPNGGYLTLQRAACAYLYNAGSSVLPLAAFTTADGFFQQETGTDNGPDGFPDTIFLSVVTSP